MTVMLDGSRRGYEYGEAGWEFRSSIRREPSSTVLVNYAARLAHVAERKARKELKPALWPQCVKDLATSIESRPAIRMQAVSMFNEIPQRPPYLEDPTRYKQILDYHHMLAAVAYIITEVAPEWSLGEYNSALIGCPFNAILDWPMATQSGNAFFLDPEINVLFGRILKYWTVNILNTSLSRHVLTEASEGWLSLEARQRLEFETNKDGSSMKFEQLFMCNPRSDEHWGFQSWNDFFTRRFRHIDTVRPIEHLGDRKWINNACESVPFALKTNVKRRDTFWLKGQPYSVADILNQHEDAEKFIGGTVYQAFLSFTTYHRWHSPVTGRITRIEHVKGTFFSQPAAFGFTNPAGPDPVAIETGQGYTAHVATRTIVVIEVPPPIRWLCVVFVGMADVSGCEVAEKFRGSLPQPVTKGEDIGTFRSGGSTYCLLLPAGLKVRWEAHSLSTSQSGNILARAALMNVG